MAECYECGQPIGKELCPECGVDQYGNNEDELINCCFPDCGCDGARLCDAKNGASDRANAQNVESMWDRKKIKSYAGRRRARQAVGALYGDVLKGN